MLPVLNYTNMYSFCRGILVIYFISLCFLNVKAQIPSDNNQCLKCHSQHSFVMYNEWTEQDQKRLMNPFYVLDTMQIKTGVHGAFKCIDCHSYEYETYPHSGELKMEPLMTCIDCHGGDDTYASYQFERIEEEFQKSVHYQLHNESFTCSKCHSQHYYKATARTSESINEIVEFSNNMCLSCHNSVAHYQLFSESESPEISQIHEWLPNQKLHFDKVRCIECHTVAKDSLMVSHNILPKAEATRECASCHSKNSILQASLYKYQNISSRNKEGKIGNIFANQHYVIGAFHSKTLDIILLIIFGATVLGILTHLIIRITKK